MPLTCSWLEMVSYWVYEDSELEVHARRPRMYFGELSLSRVHLWSCVQSAGSHESWSQLLIRATRGGYEILIKGLLGFLQ